MSSPTGSLRRRRPSAAAMPKQEPTSTQTHIHPAPAAVRLRASVSDSALDTAANSFVPSVHPYISEPGSPFAWLYKPHTVTGLVAAASLVIYFAFLEAPLAPDDTLRIAQRALACGAAVFLVYCSINLRDSMLLRPHPVMWRVVHGAALLYLVSLVVLLVGPVQSARAMLRVFSPSLTGERPEENDKIYASDCRVYTPGDANGPFARVKETMFDIFVAAHFFGWVAKAILLRDWRLCWALSIIWELLELTFQRILPNFHECYFDHWIVDFLLSNGLGLWLGMKLVGYLEMRRFDWTGRERESPTSATEHLARVTRQFLPHDFAHYEWRILEKPKNLVAAACVIVIFEIVELNAFFLKYVLYVPPSNTLNPARLVIWFFLSIPATREFYQYFSDDNTKRMGPNMWLAIACAIVETLIIIKFAAVTPFPPDAQIVPEVAWCWVVAGVAFTIWCALKFTNVPTSSILGRHRVWIMNSLIATVVGALLAIGVRQDVGRGLAYSADMPGF